MKFAHEFRAALEREGFPARWVDSAVPYGQLKKCLKKVQKELFTLGLDPITLAQLSHQSKEETRALRKDSGVTFQYAFDEGLSLHPKLTLFVRLENGVAVDAGLSPRTKQYLEALAAQQNGDPPLKQNNEHETRPDSSGSDSSGTPVEINSPEEGPDIREVEIPLTFDAEFFEILHGDVASLDSLQEDERKAMAEDITSLSNDVLELSRPTKYQRTDLYRWRELFEIYREACVFFSTHEIDHGSRDSITAAKQLQWFQTEVMRRGLVKKFKLSASHEALQKFIAININILTNLKFQEINQKAITKILKKFDKRTKLGVAKTFPMVLRSNTIMSETMAKAVCAQVTQDLVMIVPQLEDHLCPICSDIAWRPVRLACNHVMCIACVVKLQDMRTRSCPMCRVNVLLEADTDNLDELLAKFLKKYFPKEVRAKQIATETEDGIAIFGPTYKHPSETKCIVM